MAEAMTQGMTLAAGDYQAELLPDSGGAIGALRWRHSRLGWIDLMRPAQGAAPFKPYGTACFPMAPFANRIRESMFVFRGRTVALPTNGVGRHCLHGIAWQRPWQAERTGSGEAILSFRHDIGDWPYAFELSQQFLLGIEGLTVRLKATSRAAEPMPFGFGLHPYFPLTPLCRLTADVTGWWETDAEVL